MRWTALFDDLEAQAQQLERAARAGEVRDRVRGEVGTLSLWDRGRAGLGAGLWLRTNGNVAVAGTLARVGPDWWLVEQGDGREVVIATASVISVRGLARYSAVPRTAGQVESRLRLRLVLRGIARDRSAVRVHLVDGTVVEATIDRIGSDFIEVAAHPGSEPRRRQDIREIELLPLAGIAAVVRSL